MTIRRISHSRAKRWVGCRLSYRLHYVDKVPPKQVQAFDFGKALHSTLEVLMRDAARLADDTDRPVVLDKDRAVGLCLEACARLGVTGAYDVASAIEMTKWFVEDQETVEPETLLGVEREFLLPLANGVALQGVIDRLDVGPRGDWVEVYDYKTNKRLYTDDELADDLQLTLYAAAAERWWPRRDVRLHYWMLRHRQCQHVVRSPMEIERALAYMAEVANQINSAAEYPAMPNKWCEWCDHLHQCPEMGPMYGEYR